MRFHANLLHGICRGSDRGLWWGVLESTGCSKFPQMISRKGMEDHGLFMVVSKKHTSRMWKRMCQQACSIKFLLSQVDVVFHQDQVAYRNDLSTRGFQPHHCCSNGCANRLHLEVQSKALVYSRSHWILEAKETSYHPIRAQWLNISTPGVSSTSSAEVAEVEDEVGSGNRSRKRHALNHQNVSVFLKNENSFTKKHPIDVVWSHIYRRSARLSDCV